MKTRLILLGLCAGLCGCVSLPMEQQRAEVQALIHTRYPVAEQRSPAQTAASPLTRAAAIDLALTQSPRAAALQARLGLARADAMMAIRIANPSFGFARATASTGDARRSTRHFGLDLADALLLPVRKRFATETLARQRLLVANKMLDLAHDAEALWWRTVAAQQISRMRNAARDAATVSSELAERFFKAGNISNLQRQRERAAAAETMIAAAEAEVEALRLKGKLSAMLGMEVGTNASLPSRLPLPASIEATHQQLLDIAEQQALPLAAARAEVALAEHGLKWQRRWRWLGNAELQYERESETDGNGGALILRGPSLALSLPIFHQNQAEVAHAQAALALAQAELHAHLLSGAAHIGSGLRRVEQQQRIFGIYRDALLQAGELILSEQQARYNFMLIGAFELIQARREHYNAFEAYIQAIRDGWLARIELQRVVGSELPGHAESETEALDLDSVFNATTRVDHSAMGHGASESAPETHEMDHSKMDHSSMDHSSMPETPASSQQAPKKPVGDDEHAEHQAAPAHGDAQ